MICVSIARGRHRHVMAEHRHLVEQGAQLVEIRLDYIRRQINLKRLFRERGCPVIVTCRRLEDQGKWEGSEESRLMLLRAAIAEGVEYVDLEADIADKIPIYGKTKRIISLHNFRETPENLAEIHARLATLDADVIKIATMANEPHDNVRMLQLVRDSRIPTVGICMGEIGVPSRILAGKFGAPFTYATFHHERTLAPGQLSFWQMKDIYHYDEINAETRVYGFIADPIGQSIVPIVHNAAFRALGINSVCVPFRVPREYLSSFLHDSREWDLHGLCVGLPHRECAAAQPQQAGQGGRRHWGGQYGGLPRGPIHVWIQHGPSSGHGWLDSGHRRASRKPAGRQTGAGAGRGQRGESRGVWFAAAECGRGHHVAHVREGPATWPKPTDSRAVEWESRYSVKTDMLLNCTPVGMHPNVDETPFAHRPAAPYVAGV